MYIYIYLFIYLGWTAKCACAEGAWLSEPTVHLHSASYLWLEGLQVVSLELRTKAVSIDYACS